MVKNSCPEMQKAFWDEREDGKTFGYGSKQQGAGQRRSGKSSREKWSNNNNQKLDPRQKSFTPQEEDLVIQLHAAIGSRWPIIAQQLPGKTDSDIKILWNSKLRKKLSAMGIDPVTHKPFSQILADYGNIGAFPKARSTHFSSLSKDLKKPAIIFNKSTEQFQKCPQTLIPTHFSSSSSSSSSSPPIDLYSQLQAVNFITEASNYTKTENNTAKECESYSGFSWGDFFLEEPFSGQEADGQENRGAFLEIDKNVEGKGKCGAVEDKNVGFFEGPSSSKSFVDAMLENQDAMFSQLSCFYEEPFYY
ncbi:duplicated homeodomain-like superfamily protein [Striga asiatica]|uniref:Duplicated homeodomain-like superfamily protein n=1 Tax=Striga asiatica TaxID=4170 RepID=A0A5A7Q0Z7_STRAF|nr:duplicated homeodomain-like superfamily protein [Striga asiatica]